MNYNQRCSWNATLPRKEKTNRSICRHLMSSRGESKQYVLIRFLERVKAVADTNPSPCAMALVIFSSELEHGLFEFVNQLCDNCIVPVPYPLLHLVYCECYKVPPFCFTQKINKTSVPVSKKSYASHSAVLSSSSSSRSEIFYMIFCCCCVQLHHKSCVGCFRWLHHICIEIAFRGSVVRKVFLDYFFWWCDRRKLDYFCNEVKLWHLVPFPHIWIKTVGFKVFLRFY